jgi:NAD(P)-dependent dehydrogenase (short-subunit alcohol dehydrogenase family)
MLIDLRDKVAVITGAAQGLAKGTAVRLADEGLHLVLADIAEDKLQETQAEVLARHPANKGFAMKVDASSGEQMDRLVDEAVKRLGRIDIMFNCAGVTQPEYAFADTPQAVYDRTVNINQRGVFNGLRAACRVMRQQRSGSIINVASWWGKSGHAYFGTYCATKSAVISMTQSAALEMAEFGVRVNAISPGNMMTEMHWHHAREEAKRRGGNVKPEDISEEIRLSVPLLRCGTADDIANAVIFLASELSAYTTGHNLDVNGGCDVHSW